MSSFFKPHKHGKSFAIKPRGATSDRLRDAVNRLDSQIDQSMRAGSPLAGSLAIPRPSGPIGRARPSCPGQDCPDPNRGIEDGCCTACGRVVDETNIVSEIQFNETAGGATVVQGSFIGADQGAARPSGPGMRRIGGVIGDSRERTIREGRQMMLQYAHQLKLSDAVVNEGVQVFKLALSQNWVQGRGMIKVVPVCLYAACRRQERCRVMLIDFADLVKVNVYELGHVFKALNDIYDFGRNNIKSIIPEDLMYRFCDKLDFGDMTKDVAELAARFCQRMGLDWMVMGRRPSGICGACIFLAAQVWGFRRTVKEIVYVVKVTMHTIEQRLDEFKVVESSELTIEDFLKQELLESRHDPPSYYRTQEEWIARMEKQREERGRKRRRVLEDIGEGEIDQDDADLPDEASADGQVTTRSTPASSRKPNQDMPPPPLPLPDFSKMPQVSSFLKKSVDPKTGDTIYEAFDPDNIPAPAPRITSDKDISEGVDADDPTGDAAIDHLAATYADENATKAGKRRKAKRAPAEPLLTFNDEWEQEEEVLEKQIDEVISDPSSDEHRKALATAAYHARVKAAWARSQLPTQEVKMDEEIGDEEFDDDPEVQNCKLSPEEVRIKELIWLNANKDWLRRQQDKNFRKEMELLGPKKKKRNRVKKPRIGEGQLTPASTPGEAAVATMKKFTMSSRINLDAIKNLFPQDGRKAGPGSVAQTSRADSEVSESEAGDRNTQRARMQPDNGKKLNEEAGEDDVEEEEEEGYDDENDGFEQGYDEDDQPMYDEGEEDWE